ncbi:misfolded glycoproteins degradation protein [Pseudozyma hubeiensis SY62]|uniref:Protein OS-9 homolog n=1 Tax=Pseudozyma hubeiensis (strain SY62) TaxID=1305764 RepID=R9P0X3_PSEHS|nr:misfolded glycoproteins degradation protein [Pseudozyma hubeiensis SY62]GAC94883.1 misfolded glycoproteins degradation protein [Pseudozyma hubeiensis SY62]
MLSTSPVSAKSIVFLLGLLYLQAHGSDAAISTSAGFPQDVFARPAFQVNYGRAGGLGSTLPVKRADAIRILEQQEASASSSSSSSPHAKPPQSTDLSSLALPDGMGYRSGSQHAEPLRTLFWTLQRSSSDAFQLCSVPDFTSTPADRRASSRHASTFANSLRTRQDLIRNAQVLLDPLKKVCLYHTTDWFTYSFCHGREIRQFRRLGPQTAAHKAFKAAGGGDAGKKAALEAAEKVNSIQHPIADPEYPAFILGRWTPQNEDIVGDDQSHQRRQQQPISSDSPQQDAATGVAVSSNRDMSSVINSAGLDLVEQVQFGDWDEEELFAAEAKALSQFQDSQSNKAVEKANNAAGAGGNESQRHRYLTQRWTNGTMCDMNHQPRSVEVQFHCSNRKPSEDRIVMFKETTICNYVLIIETPRLCADAAFGSEKEEAPLPIQCHQVVGDAYKGPTVADPEELQQPTLSEIDGGAGSTTYDKVDGKAETAGDVDGAEEPVTNSHTYGDPSRFGSVHDDYYDEALGGPGAMYQHLHHDHDHHHHHHHDHDDPHHHHHHEEDETEIMVEIGLDEDGKLVVQQVSDQVPEDTKETRRRDGGKKRSDDDDHDQPLAESMDDQPIEIHLDDEDLLSVIREDQGGRLEQKLADKISEMFNKQLQKQTDAYPTSARSKEDDDKTVESKEKSGKMQTPDDMAKLYSKLMSAITGDSANARKDGREGKQTQQQQQQPALRMEKVGDSLSERVKRFYDAKQRQGKEKEQDEGAKRTRPPPPPPVEEHLEL